jgi:hypothetical protein
MTLIGSDIIDSAELFYALLVSSTDVTTLVTDGSGVHIYGPPGLPEDFILRKAIMFIGDGGAGDTNVPIGQDEFEVYCYGKTVAEARLVYRTLFAFMHRKHHVRITLSNGKTAIFQYAQKLSGPQDRVEPIEGWDYCFCSFYIHFIEIHPPA